MQYFSLKKLLVTFPNFNFIYLYPTFYFERIVFDCIDRTKEHVEIKNRGKNGEAVKLGCKMKNISAKAAKQVWTGRQPAELGTGCKTPFDLFGGKVHPLGS